MTENQQSLLQEAQVYVTDLIQNKVSKSVRFHTLDHTRDVVAACEEINSNDQYHISDEDHLALILGAWFHDTGYSGGRSRDHETVSIQHATEFLNAHNASKELTDKVIGCINATRMPQNPTTNIERIIPPRPVLYDPAIDPRVLAEPGGRTISTEVSAFKTSTGVEVRLFMPVINVPFRLIFAYNPQRAGVLDSSTLQPQEAFQFRFAVGTTF